MKTQGLLKKSSTGGCGKTGEEGLTAIVDCRIHQLLTWLKDKQKEHEELAKSLKRDAAAVLNHESRALAFLEVITEIKYRQWST